MRKLGICYRCGKYKTVRDHHYKGYDSEKIAPYCYSCDRKAHDKAREEGRCNMGLRERQRKSINSCVKRTIKQIKLSSKTISPNIQLFEQLQLNLNTETIMINSYFSGSNGHKLKVINELLFS